MIGSSGAHILNLTNLRRPVTPTFTVSGNVNIKFENGSYSIGSGTHDILDIIFKEGVNTLTFTATSGTSIVVSYQEGGL